MNRKNFIKSIGIAAVGSMFLPLAMRAQNNKFRGYEPQFFKTPWGQKVIYDKYTYSDMKAGEWLKQGHSWGEIEELKKELNESIENGEIKFSSGPVKLLDGLWLLETDGQQGIYLIETKAGLILVDPGMISNKDILVKQINQLGYNQSDVKHILLTHCHVDHSHSANYWQKQGAEIYIHQLGENPIRTGNEITAWYLTKDKEERTFPKVEGDITVFFDGDKLVFRDFQIHVIHTPGHTPDSCCFYFQINGKNVIIGGDTLFHNGKHGWMGHPYSDYETYLKSLWKLKRFAIGGTVHNEKDRIMVRNPIQFDLLLPGHTAISMENVSRDIEKAIEIMSYTIQQRRIGDDYQWTEPYTFFAEREVLGKPKIQIEFR